MDIETQPTAGFEATGLSPVILSALKAQGFTVATPIQEKAIPVALTGGDLIGIAQTGTGKTLAFALPLIDSLLKSSGRALVLAPTRELALQVEESIRKVARSIQPAMRTVCLIGGAPIFRQISDLKHNPRIIIATPGRLQDHLNQKTLNLGNVTVLVLDEADRMFDMGFAPQIKKVLSVLPAERQTMLFSATMDPQVSQLAVSYMKSPVRVEVSRAGESNAQIEQELCYISQAGKFELLLSLLIEHKGSMLVFSRTKHGAAGLTKKLNAAGHSAAEIHSNRSLNQRRAALDGFKQGKFRILVATDVAARGIDVKDISVVVNYDLPDSPEDYVHRIGRTGRAGSVGIAITMATQDQFRDVKRIESLIKQVLKLSPRSEHPAVRPAFESSGGGGRGQRSRPRSGGSRGGGQSSNKGRSRWSV